MAQKEVVNHEAHLHSKAAHKAARHRKKVYFSVALLAWALLLVLSPLYMPKLLGWAENQPVCHSNQSVCSQQLYPTTPPDQTAACSINLPRQPSFILRLDDVQAARLSPVMNITQDVLERNMSLVWGVIPNRIGNGAALDYMRSKVDDPHVEFAQHGLNHTPDEFSNVSVPQLVSMTLEGSGKMHDAFGIYPFTFIPPYDAYNSSLSQAFSNTTMHLVSGRQYEYKFDGSILYAGYTVSVIDPQGVLVSPAQVLDSCRTAFENNNLCVIIMHPQNYLGENSTNIDPDKYAYFLKLLDGLEKTGAKSITFRDLMTCGSKTAK